MNASRFTYLHVIKYLVYEDLTWPAEKGKKQLN